MIPLCARASFPVQSVWGWALTFDGAPWVAQRVWANPVEPIRGGSCASRFAMNPLSLTTWRPLPTIATPALSYPRYSRRLSPSSRIGNALRRPAYPTIPHIYRTTAPEGIVPRSLAPDSMRARSLMIVPGATLTPFAISTSSPMRAPNCGTACHSPSIWTSPAPAAARRPARATTPDPMTPSCTTLAGAKGERSLQVGARSDHAAVADRHAAADRHRRFDRPGAHLVGSLEGRRIEPEEVPRIEGVDPGAFRPDREDRGPLGEGRDGARQIVLPVLREPIDLLEDPLVERMRAGVDEVRDHLDRLLRDRDEPVPFDRGDAVGSRPLTLRDQDRGLSAAPEEVLDEPPVDELAPVQDEERSVQGGPGPGDGVGGAQLLRLRYVRDAGVERLAVLEMGLDSLAPISDDEDEVPHPVLDEGLDRGLEERSVADGDHDLWDRGGEGAHARSLAGRKDDRLHWTRLPMSVKKAIDA